ncbi:unnamed protein product [Menidia menidia]|uniref:(Atlantic silverside) hypothetical protein n=2 Tax=Menidia menidia TaxID=238744 RepID=A0A8S4AIL9_9TELE|nr:unnamed protein product [Menidia menidia]
MALTRESVLSVLVTEGGSVRKADLVSRFAASVDCADPAERERNRELFRTLVNDLAVVREVDGVRRVVLKKAYRHLVGNSEAPRPGERPRPETPYGNAEGPAGGGEEEAVDGGSSISEADQEETSGISPVQLALQRSKSGEVMLKRMLTFSVRQGEAGQAKPSSGESKPFALPLRVPPASTKVEIRKLREEPEEAGRSPLAPGRRPSRSEPAESRAPSSAVPLEQAEHEWLVKCAAGRWGHVYGLLLGDGQLAQKKDFVSGFTALHWAAKWGSSEMLHRILAAARRDGVEVDVNARAHGGYTPLHIAALHDQGYVMAALVGEYGADAAIRDNCGKKAYHYLHGGTSDTLREMLGEPRAQRRAGDGDRAAHWQRRGEPDPFPERPRSLHSLGRLFQPNATGHRKKAKQRPGLLSLSDHDPRDEREDGSGGSNGGVFRLRAASDVFIR